VSSLATTASGVPPPPASAESSSGAGSPVRMASIDAFRGLVLALMMGEALRFSGVAAARPASALWAFLAHHQQHVPWVGCSLGLRPRREQGLAMALILLAFWLAFALYPVPGPGFDWQAVGVPADWPQQMSGLQAHWNKGANLSEDFDRWFLNLFPRERPFVYNEGSWSTLSFVPTLATMILGLLAGGVLRDGRTSAGKLRWLVAAGLSFLAAGGLVQVLGLCPIVKRIWTPSFTLWSGGWCFLFLAFFYWALDLRGPRRWAFPLLVLGTNSIAAYVMNWVFVGPTEEALVRHLGHAPFRVLGPTFEATLVGAAALLTTWLVLLWMQRKRIFVRI
jgi:heparan-alpha-glucosaminide N-acetyltransferase